MTLILHTFSGAPRGWRVLLGMSFKGLTPDIRYLNYSEKDHHKPGFLKLNPRATAPTLETKTGVLRDSIAILAWLDREYPEKPLFGATPQEAGIIWQTTTECNDYLRKSTDQLLSLVFSSDGSVPAEGSAERDLQPHYHRLHHK
ncbi:MAG: glutathione S-transferase N-terminal domain-containing protein [Emcibacter sp.]|nr:glutathione S-transferase N-terminal domain-containing protein [Emcibacter sp.]